MTDHPLTETAVAEMWEGHIPERKAHYLGWRTFPGPSRRYFTTIIRAAFDAGRELEREHADPHRDARPWQDCTVGDIRKGDLVEALDKDGLRIGVAHHQNTFGDWFTEANYLITYDDNWPLRRIPATTTTEKETSMTETTPAASAEPLARTLLAVPDTHGTPHHDADAIKPGDFVAEVNKDGTICSGRAHHQDADGDWRTENHVCITWAPYRADHPEAVTVWPAPTPPAEEVELPTEHPAHILDVEDIYGDVCAYMALDRDGFWIGVDGDGSSCAWEYDDLTAFTLPDGTRARRDGKREDGSPRFIKEDNK